MQRVFVLGADDPEMRAIVDCLEKTRQRFWYAAVDGTRCHPGNAYSANSIVSPVGESLQLRSGYNAFVFVECRPWDVPLAEKHSRLSVIDHHEECDPGYALGPEDFWEASSLGQVVRTLLYAGKPLAVTHQLRVLAAMDHCRQAAIRGECPGITSDEVLERRVQEIAFAKKTSPSVVREMIKRFCAVFRRSTLRLFGPGQVIDFSGQHLGVGYNLRLLCAQTALDVVGVAALLRYNQTEDARSECVTLSGHATPAMVVYFMKDFAVERDLRGVYGVPARGYAGGYVRS